MANGWTTILGIMVSLRFSAIDPNGSRNAKADWNHPSSSPAGAVAVPDGMISDGNVNGWGVLRECDFWRFQEITGLPKTIRKSWMVDDGWY